MYTAQRPGFLLISFLLAFAMLAISSSAFAHKVNMFAFVEGDEVFVEGYFADGKRAHDSEVIVYDHSGKELLRGTTDKEGAFTFKIPAKDDLRITLNAGMGHKTEYVIAKDEISGMVDEGNPFSSDETGAEATADEPASGVETTASSPPATVSKAAIRRAVGEAIRPLMRSISELQESRSFSDIIGGVGFIIGIGGIFFYLKARRMMQGGSKPQ